MADIVSIDNVPLTAFICSRRTPDVPTRNRIFKAKCGSKVTFVIASTGTVKRIEYGHEMCKNDCISCDVMALDAKKIITGA